MSNRWQPYLYLAPALILFGVFNAYPVARSVLMSFQEYEFLKPGANRYVGLDNYREALTDFKVRVAFENTVCPLKRARESWASWARRIPGGFTVTFLPIYVLLPLPIAFLIDRLRRQAFMRVVTFLPVVVSGAVVAVMWTTLYHPTYGPLNRMLSRLCGTGPLNFLGDPRLAMPSLVAMSVWHGMGFNVLLYLVRLAGIPRELYEAAAVDGAGRWGIFRRVTLPLMRPMICLVAIVGLIGSVKVFGPMFIMTYGGPGNATVSLVMYIYQTAFQFGDLRFGYAAAVAVLLALLVMAFAIVSSRLNRPVEGE